MTQFEALLGTDFEGNRTDDVDDVIYGGYDHFEHRDRVPGLVALLGDISAPDRERYLACLALVAWGEPVGYQAIREATRDPRAAPWYDLVMDRKFSVDSSYGKFSEATADSRELAEEKNSSALRLETFRSLIGVADREYFEEKLGDYLEEPVVRACLPDIREVIARGLESIESGVRCRFDLPTQLVDLANSIVSVDEELGVDLIMQILHAAPADRTMIHAVTGVYRATGPAGRSLAEYLALTGNERVRSLLAEKS
ncbi:hypothetical protein OOK31_04040 [Streptomyces sp. NBC_00249]|uniref:hypothetical protein n=1 Tax=Streptomyces sp. NBC_00249 TaxID=2975690 RepID=UPI002254B9DA|nr:hypothetical protein [Streptomyces sp. NBC_00249]MCX5193069.1 hypothetical protein [Streptomyces sp. NBC_00249]